MVPPCKSSATQLKMLVVSGLTWISVQCEIGYNFTFFKCALVKKKKRQNGLLGFSLSLFLLAKCHYKKGKICIFFMIIWLYFSRSPFIDLCVFSIPPLLLLMCKKRYCVRERGRRKLLDIFLLLEYSREREREGGGEALIFVLYYISLYKRERLDVLLLYKQRPEKLGRVDRLCWRSSPEWSIHLFLLIDSTAGCTRTKSLRGLLLRTTPR